MVLTQATALHRFGMGAAPGEAQRVAEDPIAWISGQLRRGPGPSDPRLLQKDVAAVRQATQQADRETRRIAVQALFRNVMADLRRALGPRLHAAAESDAPVFERLAWFWTNHFTVSAKGKPRVAPFVRSYVDDAIRPHVLGRFEDLLLAVVRHPAMLIYLDNVASVGPNAPAGRRAKRGLNENLAREILELHALGVNGGYVQEDVIQLARALTGWTSLLGRSARPDAPAFSFVNARHEPGDKTILGKRYGETGLRRAEVHIERTAVGTRVGPHPSNHPH